MIEITLNGSAKEVSAFGLTQWDKGQKLKIIWKEMPESFQVHFASRNSQEAIVAEAKGESGVAVVDIPDELLKNSADIYAWIYLTQDEKEGESVKRAVLYVRPRAKPHTLVDDLEMTQQEILENILSDVKQNIRDIKENGTDAEYLPDYIVRETEKVLSKVSDYQTENSVVFIASSDAHFKTGDYNSETSLRHLSQAMSLICERYPMDFAVNLGDMTSGGTAKSIEEAKKEIMRVNAALFSPYHALPSFICSGAEDNLLGSYYRNGKYITQTDIYNLIGRWNKGVSVPEEYRAAGYFYRDLESIKVRVICLNTSDNYGKILNASSETAVMSNIQLQWLCESLDLSDKTDSGEWGIILLGHHPLNMIDKFTLAVRILDAYIKGNEINVINDSGEQIAYNFSGRNSAKIFAQFHGHLHNYKVNFITDSNIPLVCIPNASFYNNNFYAADKYTQEENLTYSDDLTYNKSVNTAKDTAFCVIVIDKTTGKINAVHYGSGVDRTIEGTTINKDSSDDSGSADNNGNPDSGGEPGGDNTEDSGDVGDGTSYTNLVPTSTTTSGIIHNKNGYTDGYKLNSQGEIKYGPGYVYTGYMVACSGDIIRIAGGTYDGTVGNYIFVYDSSYNLLWVATLTGEDNEAAGLEYTDSGVIRFYPSMVQTGNLETMAYIRLSTVGVGSDLIVTRNEEIPDMESSGTITPPVVNYANILKYATDENGNVYGTDGCSNNTKLTDEGTDVTANGYVASGYLVLYSDAVVRTKGLSFDGGEGCCLCLYNSEYQLIKCIALSTFDDSVNGITYENGIHTFIPANATSDLDSMTYFRISGKGKSSDFVITYNEEIN